MEGRLSEQLDKLDHALKITSTTNVLREAERLAHVRNAMKETTREQPPTQEKPPSPPPAPKGGLLGRMFGRK